MNSPSYATWSLYMPWTCRYMAVTSHCSFWHLLHTCVHNHADSPENPQRLLAMEL